MVNVQNAISLIKNSTKKYNVPEIDANELAARVMQDQFTMSHHRGIVAPAPAKEGETVVSREDVATANMNLSTYGVTMSKELMEVCFSASVDAFHLFYGILESIVAADTKAIDAGKTVWPHYPHDAMNAPLVVLYIANLFNYLSGGQWQPEFMDSVKDAVPTLDVDKLRALKVIPLCPEDGAASLVKELITNSIPMSSDDISDIKVLMSDKAFLKSVMEKMQGCEIPVKENLALYVAITMDEYGDALFEQKFISGFKTAKDVLRLAVACSDGDVSLYKKTMFRNFSRKERKMLLGLIELTSNIEESMSTNREQWKRLGEKLHPGEYQYMFPNTEKAFAKIRAGVRIETFNSILESLLKAPIDVEKLSKHLMQRPGMFAQYLDTCIRNCKDEDEMGKVSFQFISVAKSVSPRVLLQLINHFRNRNNSVALATARKSGAKSRAVDRVVASIDKQYCARLAQDISNELWQVLRQESDVGVSVYMDPDCHCDKIVFPDNVRQLSSGSRVAACGSRFNMPAGNLIRAFLFWKSNDEWEYDGIDLDLSMTFMDSDMKIVSFVSYFSPEGRDIGAIHSGDRRYSGPTGAVEYIDFDIDAAKKAGIRYAVMFVNSYSGQVFSSMESAFCGVMVRDGTGETFEPRTVTDRFDMTTESRDAVPIMLDLYTGEIIVVDRAVGTHRGDNAFTRDENIRSVCEYTLNLKSLTISEMVRYKYPAIKDSWKDADIIISSDQDKFSDKKRTAKILNPFDTQSITNLVFGS